MNRERETKRLIRVGRIGERKAAEGMQAVLPLESKMRTYTYIMT